MNIDLMGHWRGGAVRDAAEEAIRLHGTDAINNINIGPLESAYGATPENVRNYIQTKQQSALNNSHLRERAIAAGLTGADGAGGADYNDTTASYLAKIVEQEKAVEKQKTEKDRLLKIEDENRALQSAIRLKNVDNAAARDQYLHESRRQDARYLHESTQSDKRRSFERRENMMNRRHDRESQTLSNDMNMQISLMQNDLAEKRMNYDRETRRLDRRDKMIAQLMSGLGQLGGAFAL